MNDPTYVIIVARSIVQSGYEMQAFMNAINKTSEYPKSWYDIKKYGKLVGREISSYLEKETSVQSVSDRNYDMGKIMYNYLGRVYFRAVRAAISAGEEVRAAFNESITKRSVDAITRNVLLINAVNAAAIVIDNRKTEEGVDETHMKATDDAAAAAAADVVANFRKINELNSLFGNLSIGERRLGGSKTKRQRKQRNIKQRQRKQKSKRKKN